jgi:hypothetical protein
MNRALQEAKEALTDGWDIYQFDMKSTTLPYGKEDTE